MTAVPYEEVIVGTDGSRTATRAVRSAAALAAALGVPLSVVTAWARRRDDAPVASEEARYPGGVAERHEARWATTTTADAAAVARGLGVTDVRQHTPVGAPADALVRLGEQHPGALLVVGTAGLAERTERVVGNVPHQLTHHAGRDLLLVRSGTDDGPHRWRRVALATDGSRTAARACRRGHALATALAAEVVLLTVDRDRGHGEEVLGRAAADLPDGDALTREVALAPDAARGLTEAATTYDLLVLGNRRMSGPSRLLGSVSNPVTHHVPTDLLLVDTTR